MEGRGRRVTRKGRRGPSVRFIFRRLKKVLTRGILREGIPDSQLKGPRNFRWVGFPEIVKRWDNNSDKIAVVITTREPKLNLLWFLVVESGTPIGHLGGEWWQMRVSSPHRKFNKESIVIQIRPVTALQVPLSKKVIEFFFSFRCSSPMVVNTLDSFVSLVCRLSVLSLLTVR